MNAEKSLLLIAGLLQMYSTQGDDLPCNVSQRAEQTSYSIPWVDASQHFFWSNDTDHTVAFQVDSILNKTDQVVKFNKTHLFLMDCKEVILYKATDLKGVAHTANCTTTCIQSPGEPAGRGPFWIALGLFAAILLVVGVVAFMCCRTRKQNQLRIAQDKHDEHNPNAENLLPL